MPKNVPKPTRAKNSTDKTKDGNDTNVDKKIKQKASFTKAFRGIKYRARRELTGTQYALFDFIYDQTIGWQKYQDRISISQFCENVHGVKRTLIDNLRQLEQVGWIYAMNGRTVGGMPIKLYSLGEEAYKSSAVSTLLCNEGKSSAVSTLLSDKSSAVSTLTEDLRFKEDLNPRTTTEAQATVSCNEDAEHGRENQDDVVVVSGNNSKEAEIAELITELCEIAKIGEVKSSEVIMSLVEKHGRAMVGKQVTNVKASPGVKNPVNWLRKACIEDFELDEVAHIYKVEEQKSEELINADAKELRQGASVDRETAFRLASEYNSNYLRRQIAQIKRDFSLGKRLADPGKGLARRVEAGYEPADYPPPLEDDQSEENDKQKGRSRQKTKREHDPDIGRLNVDWL